MSVLKMFLNQRRDGKKIGVYVLMNTKNNKMYIGQSNNPIEERYWVHISTLRNNKHYNRLLQNDYNVYKEDSFIFYLLEECSDTKNREKYWIRVLDTYGSGYNLTYGGDGALGVVVSNETKKRIGEKNRINNLGNKASLSTRAKMSESQKKVKRNHSQYAKMNSTRMSRYDGKHRRPYTKEELGRLSKRFEGSKSNLATINEKSAYQIKQMILVGMSNQTIHEKTKVNVSIIKTIRCNSRWKHVYCDGWDDYVDAYAKEKNDKIKNKQDDGIKIIDMYNKKYSVYKISKKVNRSRGFVTKVLRDNNLWQPCAKPSER